MYETIYFLTLILFNIWRDVVRTASSSPWRKRLEGLPAFCTFLRHVLSCDNGSDGAMFILETTKRRKKTLITN